jgi:thermostable 8-oxoguanine DNA glycosylase
MIVQMELPNADDELLPGVTWGAIEAFPSPAYWAYQVAARRALGQRIYHRIGESLREEVAACILGGHGIPASVGLAAFRNLKALGSLERVSTQEALLAQLSQPLVVNERPVRYRFARQKARYLHAALSALERATPPTHCGQALRDWLVCLPGVGYKTASWIARNWLDADDVAILDIHVLRAGALAGFLDESLRVERHYRELEKQFLRFSAAIGVRASELDAVIWSEMMSSPSTVRGFIRDVTDLTGRHRSLGRAADVSNAHTRQTRLVD